jgi:hypothetical protein
LVFGSNEIERSGCPPEIPSPPRDDKGAFKSTPFMGSKFVMG